MDRDSNRLFVVRVMALFLFGGAPTLAYAADTTSSCLTMTDCARECEAGNANACVRATARLKKYAEPQERLAVYGPACAAGHLPACVEQAQVLIRGSADEWRQAAELLQKTCDQGEASACRELGALYEQGKGVAKDSLRAAVLVQSACDAGYSPGCVALSEAFARGQGVAKDPAKAWQVLEDSCAAGGGTACSWMSSHLSRKTLWGPPKDEARSQALQRTACERGHLPACDQLLKKATDAKDTAESTRLLTLLCEQLDQPSACRKLRGTLKFDDAAGKAPLALRGCELGDRNACAEAAALLPQLTPPDHVRAFAIHDALCRDGAPDSSDCIEVAKARARGLGTKADPAGATKELLALCDRDPSRCDIVANLYEDGAAGKRDLEKALALYKRACPGNEFDCFNVRRVNLLRKLEALAPGCAANDARACLEVGKLRASEGHLLNDGEQPVDAFRKACELGNDEGCVEQASSLSRSKDDAQVKRARPLLAALCKKRVVAACIRLAEWQMTGEAGEAQPEHGKQTLHSLCQAGEDLACKRLGSALLYGRNRQVKEAIAILDEACARTRGPETCELAGSLDYHREQLKQETACDGGDADACRQRTQSGRIGPETLPFASKACDAGHLDVCEALLGFATDQKRKEGPDLGSAFTARHRLCLAGGTALCVDAARQLIEGKGVPADPAAARLLLTNTCDDTRAHGCHLIGRLHAEGLGGPKDARLALRALRRACGPAHPDACRSAGELARDTEPPVKDAALALALFRVGCQHKEEASCAAATELDAKFRPARAAAPARLAGDARKYGKPSRPGKAPRRRYSDDDDWSSRAKDTGYGWGAWEAGALQLTPKTSSATSAWVGLVAYDALGSTLDRREKVGFGWSYRIGLLPETSRIGYDLQAGIWMPIRLSILTIVPGYVVGYDAIGAAGSADDNRVVVDGSLVNGWAIKVGLRVFSGLRLQADAARLERRDDVTSPELRLGARLIIPTRKRVYSVGALRYDFGDASRATGGSVQVDF